MIAEARMRIKEKGRQSMHSELQLAKVGCLDICFFMSRSWRIEYESLIKILYLNH
jgi:hypothetical protein